MNYLCKSTPYPYQETVTQMAANYVFNLGYCALYAQQGTGKTKMTIDLAQNLYAEGFVKQLLIIAPNGVHTQWIDEQMPLHCAVNYDAHVWHAGKQKAFYKWLKIKRDDALRVFAVNVEALSHASIIPILRDFIQDDETFCVVDEATDIGHMTSTRAKTATFAMSQEWEGKFNLKQVTPICKYRMVLTGTPFAQGVDALFGMSSFLKYGLIARSYTAYQARYVMKMISQEVPTPIKIPQGVIYAIRDLLKKGVTEDEIAMKYHTDRCNVEWIRDHPNQGTPYKNVDELREKIKPFSIFLNKEDCLGLPDKVYQTEWVEMSPEQRKLYNQLKKDGAAAFNGVALTVANTAALRTRLMQVCGGFFPYNVDEDGNNIKQATPVPLCERPPKVERLMAKLEQLNGEQVVVVTRFRAEAELLAATMANEGYTGALVLGGISAREKDEGIKAFTAKEVQVLIATEHTIARGFNLQQCHEMFFYSLNQSMEDLLQIEDRLHRVGQKNNVMYTFFLASNSLDQLQYQEMSNARGNGNLFDVRKALQQELFGNT